MIIKKRGRILKERITQKWNGNKARETTTPNTRNQEKKIIPKSIKIPPIDLKTKIWAIDSYTLYFAVTKREQNIMNKKSTISIKNQAIHLFLLNITKIEKIKINQKNSR